MSDETDFGVDGRIAGEQFRSHVQVRWRLRVREAIRRRRLGQSGRRIEDTINARIERLMLFGESEES